MLILDLCSIRCPLALVTLKRALLSTTDNRNRSLKLLFSNKSAMSDIILYLDKKSYHYQLLKDKNLFIVIITRHKSKGSKEC